MIYMTPARIKAAIHRAPTTEEFRRVMSYLRSEEWEVVEGEGTDTFAGPKDKEGFAADWDWFRANQEQVLGYLSPSAIGCGGFEFEDVEGLCDLPKDAGDSSLLPSDKAILDLIEALASGTDGIIIVAAGRIRSGCEIWEKKIHALIGQLMWEGFLPIRVGLSSGPSDQSDPGESLFPVPLEVQLDLQLEGKWRSLNAINQLSASAVACLIQHSAGVVCSYSSVHMFARRERIPQLLLHPDGGRGAIDAGYEGCISAPFDVFDGHRDQFMEQFVDAVNSIHTSNPLAIDKYCPPYMLSELKISGPVSLGSEVEQGLQTKLKMIEWYAKNGRHEQACAHALEWCVSVRCWKIGGDYNDAKSRTKQENCLGAAVALRRSDEVTFSAEWNELIKQADFVLALRDDLAHFKNEREVGTVLKATVLKAVESLPERLRQAALALGLEVGQ